MSKVSTVSVFAGVALFVGLVGCGGEDGAEPNAESLQIFEQIEGYSSWRNIGDKDSRTLSSTHSGMYTVSYHNDVAREAIESGSLPFPQGAIIVKESYASADDADPVALSIMAKQSSTAGDWYWIQSPGNSRVVVDGGSALEGRDVPMCASCHAAVAETDHVYLNTYGVTLGPASGADDL
jgi:hypothetical protein